MKVITILFSAAVFTWVVSQPYEQSSEPNAKTAPKKWETIASYYGARYAKKPTASGEPFDPTALTAAMWDVPFGTSVLVEHNGRSVICKINDRGPNKRFTERGIDLSQASFERLADTRLGLIPVTITILD